MYEAIPSPQFEVQQLAFAVTSTGRIQPTVEYFLDLENTNFFVCAS